jgi:Cys-tRNA(Pro)/Cys-tRNA(Cys) deacylase
MKTNATRQLDKLRIGYKLLEYEVELDDLSAPNVALKIGLPSEQVFKTLVATGDKTGVVFAVVPGNKDVDLKALAKASGNRRMELVPLKKVQPLTGYVRGGVSALAGKKSFPVFMESAMDHPLISVSAGVRGTQILLAPSDYLKAVNGSVAAISRAEQISGS